MKIGVKMKKAKDAIDSKAIEEKALNHFFLSLEENVLLRGTNGGQNRG